MKLMRVARPTDRLDDITSMNISGLGFRLLGSFKGHNGFDGVIIEIHLISKIYIIENRLYQYLLRSLDNGFPEISLISNSMRGFDFRKITCHCEGCVLSILDRYNRARQKIALESNSDRGLVR